VAEPSLQSWKRHKTLSKHHIHYPRDEDWDPRGSDTISYGLPEHLLKVHSEYEMRMPNRKPDASLFEMTLEDKKI
jgi:hypothetical protein